MPFVHVTSNVSLASVDTNEVLKVLSKTLSEALQKPEVKCMVQLTLDTPMMFSGTTEPCAMIYVHSIGKIDPETNAVSASLLTAAASKALNVPSHRIFMNFKDVDRTNWGLNGNVL